jgi:hypothetical protein
MRGAKVALVVSEHRDITELAATQMLMKRGIYPS